MDPQQRLVPWCDAAAAGVGVENRNSTGTRKSTWILICFGRMVQRYYMKSLFISIHHYSSLFIYFLFSTDFNGHFRNQLIGGTDSIYKAYFSGLIFSELPLIFTDGDLVWSRVPVCGAWVRNHCGRRLRPATIRFWTATRNKRPGWSCHFMMFLWCFMPPTIPPVTGNDHEWSISIDHFGQTVPSFSSWHFSLLVFRHFLGSMLWWSLVALLTSSFPGPAVADWQQRCCDYRRFQQWLDPSSKWWHPPETQFSHLHTSGDRWAKSWVFPKSWGYPQLSSIDFCFSMKNKLSSYWGTPIYGNPQIGIFSSLEVLVVWEDLDMAWHGGSRGSQLLCIFEVRSIHTRRLGHLHRWQLHVGPPSLIWDAGHGSHGTDVGQKSVAH